MLGAYKPNVDELSRNSRGQNSREKLERDAAAREKAECTFRPKLVADGSKRSPAAVAARVFRDEGERLREKDERRQLALRERELENLRECSFQPRVNHRNSRERPSQCDTGRATAVKPVVVRGLARHLELRDLARKRTEEQRTREHEAFHVPKAEGWRRGQKFTTPQPFELTS